MSRLSLRPRTATPVRLHQLAHYDNHVLTALFEMKPIPMQYPPGPRGNMVQTPKYPILRNLNSVVDHSLASGYS